MSHTPDATGWRDIDTLEALARLICVSLGDTPDALPHNPSLPQEPLWRTDYLPTAEKIAVWAIGRPLPAPPGEEVESERERIARELREHAERSGDPSGWIGAIADAIETDGSAINDPENFKNEPCRFAVMRERDGLQARCDKLEAAAREACDMEDIVDEHTLARLRSVVDGGA